MVLSPVVARLSIVICCYTTDRLDPLYAAVDSALAQARTTPEDAVPADEVIVVVDHNPALFDVLQQQFGAQIILEHNTFRPGLSGARNTGVLRAAGDVVVFLDDDAALEPGALDSVRAAFTDPATVAIGGAVTPRWQAGGPPHWFPPEFGWVVGCDYRGLPADGAEIRNPIGAAMAVRRPALVAVDGFSARLGRVGRLPTGCEETLMGIALREAFPQQQIRRHTSFAVHHQVPAARATITYFARRCFHEGRSKAILSRICGPTAALASERAHTRRILTTGLWSARGAPVRAVALLAGLMITAVGYLLGRLDTSGAVLFWKGAPRMRARVVLHNLRLTRVAAALIGLYFIAEWVVSATWRGHYGYRDDLTGLLGVEFCGTQGNWPCSELYPVMNVALALTGLCLLILAAGWAVQRATSAPHAVLLALAGLALAGSGVVTQRTDFPLHFTFWNAFMVLGAVAITLIATGSTAFPTGARRFAATAGAVATVGYFCYIGGFTALLGAGGTERLVVYSVLVSAVVLGLSRRPGASTADTTDIHSADAAVPLR